ncbi:MAG: PaaI family thioesterase [Myxococcota bacterium]
MEGIRSWLEGSPYGEALGVELDRLDAEGVRLVLPYRDENSNPGKALHGGVAASMIQLAAQAVARAALGAEAAPWHTSALQVAYLSAAIGEPIVAEGALLRRGKELCFVDVAVSTEAGKPVARGLATVRGRFGARDATRPVAVGDDGACDPGPMGPHIGRVPFIGALGLRVEHMTGGRSRIVLPWRERNADADGGVHEGALLALLDTTGAMAGWAETGPGRYKASTPGIQARVLAPPPCADLVGYGRMVHRDAEILFCEVDVADLPEGRLVARGAVNYRIVVPADAG